MADAVTPEIYQTALREFRWMSLKFGDWVGKPVRHAVNAVSHVPSARPIRGMILGQEPREDCLAHVQELDRLFCEAVETAAVEMGRFFGAIEQGMPFSEALGRDFSGKEEEECGLH